MKDQLLKVKWIIEKMQKKFYGKKEYLPFSSGVFDLASKEEPMMIREGLLKIDDGKYYVPEMIRHSLKFRYNRGARPKGLSLLSIK